MYDYTVEDPLVMIPGPTPLSARVREALAAPVRSHASPENAASLGRVREGLRQLTGTLDGDVYVLPGSGTLAMEAALVNHVRPGERVVLVNQGYFGERFADICAVHGIEADQVRPAWGSRADLSEVERMVATPQPPALLIVTHVDTSTGVMAAVPELAKLAAARGVMVLVDGVCATGAIAEEMDSWGVDLIVTGSQKALACPPGLAIVVASANARERRRRVGRPNAYYLDLSRWDAPMTGTAYFATHATGLVRAMDVSMAEILEEGLPERFRRHREVADFTRRGFTEMGFAPLTDEAALAPTLSVLAPPAGVDEAKLRADMLADGVLIAGCIGAFAGKGIRVGHMGSAGKPEVEVTLAAVKRALA
ncbi:MAG: pyridoxal-phosphate-dependent aminotransferase family protein [Candidatus Dormibacteria bacterium]